MLKNIQSLSQFLIFEITRRLPLKDTLILSGVCAELHRKIYYKNASGDYICLKQTGKNPRTEESAQSYLNYLLINNALKKLWSGNEFFKTFFKMLLKAGMDINYQDCYGESILISATSHNDNEEIIKFLLEHGANTNLQNDNNETALMWACYEDSPKTIKLLLEAGTDIGLQDDEGNTALMTWARSNDAVKSFLDYGADIDHQNASGQTALMRACSNNRVNIIKVLVEYGADTTLLDNNGSSAQELSFLINTPHRHKDIVKLLKLEI